MNPTTRSTLWRRYPDSVGFLLRATPGDTPAKNIWHVGAKSIGHMRIVRYDTDAFLEVSERLLEEGYRVRFRASGGSMRPAINDGDSVTVAPVDRVAVQPSNILLYRRHRRGIAHRVVHVLRAGERVVAFLLRGDATAAFDAAVAPGEILGRVVTVERSRGRAPSRWRVRIPRFVRSAVSRITDR